MGPFPFISHRLAPGKRRLQKSIDPARHQPVSCGRLKTILPPADPTALTQPSDAARLRGWLRLPLDCVAMACGILYWGVFGLGVTLLAGPLFLLLPREAGRRLGRWLHHVLFRCFVGYLHLTGLVKTDLRPLDALRRATGPIIVAPNHTSLWDAVFIIARLPSAVCVMKKSILCNPFLGGGARLSGYIANSSITRMIRDAAGSLSGNSQLILFPEATRTRPHERWINPIKGGCALIACRSGAPVYPVFIRSDTRFLQKGWPIWKRPVFPIHLAFEVGAPLRPEKDESPMEFTLRLQAVFEQELSKPHPLRRQVHSPDR